MPGSFPRRFFSPESLKTISPANLVAMLLPYKDYLAGRGLEVPPPDGSEIDYDLLVEILMDPDAAMPREMLECFYHVHETSTPEIMLELLDEMPPGVLAQGTDLSPADVAAQVWLKDRDLLERKHSEQYLVRPKSFTSYKGAKGELKAPPPVAPEVIRCMEAEIDDWNLAHKRSRGCRMFVHPRDSELWCLIRRSDPFRREGALEDGKSSGVYYYPEKFDIVIYSPEPDTLQVTRGAKGQQQLYREVLGKHLFGATDYFGVAGRYSLDPLRERGAEVLNCSAVAGIRWIRLTQVEIFKGNRLTIRYSHDDLVSVLGEELATILASGFITKASFAVKFVDAKIPRSVSVWQSGRASYTRDEDRLLVEAWMKVQGILMTASEAGDEEAETALADI